MIHEHRLHEMFFIWISIEIITQRNKTHLMMPKFVRNRIKGSLHMALNGIDLFRSFENSPKDFNLFCKQKTELRRKKSVNWNVETSSLTRQFWLSVGQMSLTAQTAT